MFFRAFDNSGVETRQVRRQMERLAKKKLPHPVKGATTRADLVVVPPSYRLSRSRYKPHQGAKECARRVEQANRKDMGLTRAFRWKTVQVSKPFFDAA
jgi:hypothetical protein